MSSIILRYIARELLLSWMVVMVVLAVIMLGSALTETLYLIAKGAVPRDGALTVMAIEFLGLWGVILPLSSAVATAMVITRLYTSSEMAGVFSCGIGGAQLMLPVILAFLPVVILGWYVAAFALPTLEKNKLEFMSASGPATMLGQIEAKSLRQFGQGLILYVEAVGPEALENIFVFQQQGPDSVMVEVAKRARIAQVESGAELLLENGQVLHWEGDQVRTVNYEQHRGQLRQWIKPHAGSLAEFNWLELDRSPEHRNEFHARVVVPLITLVLPLLVAQFSHLQPRQNSAKPIFIALLCFLMLGNIMASLLDSQLALDNTYVIYLPIILTALIAAWAALRRDQKI